MPDVDNELRRRVINVIHSVPSSRIHMDDAAIEHEADEVIRTVLTYLLEEADLRTPQPVRQLRGHEVVKENAKRHEKLKITTLPVKVCLLCRHSIDEHRIGDAAVCSICGCDGELEKPDKTEKGKEKR